jgi:uncharacterized membrane protein YbhN (UPF0104 family)
MKFGWRGALGILISATFLYFAFRNLDLGRALETARHANYWLLLCSAAAATGMFSLRARRWRTILDPVAPNLPFGPLWRATAIGVMVTNVIPLRAGELARPLALTRQLPSVGFQPLWRPSPSIGCSTPSLSSFCSPSASSPRTSPRPRRS